MLRLLASMEAQSDGSPYVFLTLDRLAKIDAETKAKGKLGPNYEAVNNLNARFDHLHAKARTLLAKEPGTDVEKMAWQRHNPRPSPYVRHANEPHSPRARAHRVRGPLQDHDDAGVLPRGGDGRR